MKSATGKRLSSGRIAIKCSCGHIGKAKTWHREFVFRCRCKQEIAVIVK